MGREAARIEVEYVSDDRLLFSARELKARRRSFCARGDSFGAFSKSTVIDGKRRRSSAVASELAGVESLEGKLESPFALEQ
jgi:hypothetical protein